MSRNPTDWMWSQACEMLDQAERLHRQFFHLTSTHSAQPVWEPPVDVLENEEEIIIVVALPGADARDIDVSIEGSVLLIRAQAPIPFSERTHKLQRLEIPYGRFERRIKVPALHLNDSSREYVNGCLVVTLRKVN